jgi:hypothetical protein
MCRKQTINIQGLINAVEHVDEDREECRTSSFCSEVNDQRFAEATPIDKAWEEIVDGTFLDDFKETSESHALPPEVLVRFSEWSDRSDVRRASSRPVTGPS